MAALTLALWATLAVTAVGCEIGGRFVASGRLKSSHLAPFGHVLGRLRARSWGRAALLLSWLWLGWHLFAR